MKLDHCKSFNDVGLPLVPGCSTEVPGTPPLQGLGSSQGLGMDNWRGFLVNMLCD